MNAHLYEFLHSRISWSIHDQESHVLELDFSRFWAPGFHGGHLKLRLYSKIKINIAVYLQLWMQNSVTYKKFRVPSQILDHSAKLGLQWGSGKSHHVHEFFSSVDERQMGGILCPHSSLCNYPISVQRNKSNPQNEQTMRLMHREIWQLLTSFSYVTIYTCWAWQ